MADRNLIAGAGAVAASEGFVDYGGAFMKGYEKSLEGKRKKENENKATQDRLNKLMSGFTNDVDVIKFKPEDQKIVKNKITGWRNEYATAANAASKIQDKSGSDYQQQVDIMNDIQSRMSNLKSNIDGLAAFKGEYADNIRAGAYSVAGANTAPIANGAKMIESPIGNIDDNGNLLWGEGENQFNFQDYTKPFGKANDIAIALGDMADAQQNRTQPLTDLQKDGIRRKVAKYLDSPEVLASFIADSELEEFDFSDIDPENIDAKRIVTERITNSLFDIANKAVAKKTVSPTGDTRTSAQKDYDAAVSRIEKAYTQRVPIVIEKQSTRVSPAGKDGWVVEEWDPVEKMWVESKQRERKTLEGLIGLLPVI